MLIVGVERVATTLTLVSTASDISETPISVTISSPGKQRGRTAIRNRYSRVGEGDGRGHGRRDRVTHVGRNRVPDTVSVSTSSRLAKRRLVIFRVDRVVEKYWRPCLSFKEGRVEHLDPRHDGILVGAEELMEDGNKYGTVKEKRP